MGSETCRSSSITVYSLEHLLIKQEMQLFFLWDNINKTTFSSPATIKCEIQSTGSETESEYPTLLFASPKHFNAAFHQGCSSQPATTENGFWTRIFPGKWQFCICIPKNSYMETSLFRCWQLLLSRFITILPSFLKIIIINPSVISYTSNSGTNIKPDCLFVVCWPWLAPRFPTNHSYHSPFLAGQRKKIMNSSQVMIRTERSFTNYHHEQTRLDLGKIM